jgi:hypothetical protein
MDRRGQLALVVGVAALGVVVVLFLARPAAPPPTSSPSPSAAATSSPTATVAATQSASPDHNGAITPVSDTNYFAVLTHHGPSYFVVTALDAAGNESGWSTEGIVAPIP